MTNVKSNQNSSSNDQAGEMVDVAAKAAFICLVAFCILAVTVHAAFAFLFGYLYYFAWKEDKGRGLFTVALIHAAVTYFVAGPPLALMPYDAQGLWNGLLLEDFGRKFQEGYVNLCQFFHQKPSDPGFWKWVGIANLGFYLIPAVAAMAALFYFPKKEFHPRGYLWLKVVMGRIQWANLYLPFRIGGGGRVVGAIFCLLLNALFAALLYRFRYEWPAYTWAFHLGILIFGCLTCFGEIEILSAPEAGEVTKKAQGKVELSRDGTPLTLEQINHHVHILGGSGYGKSVLVSHITGHHIDQGMGMVFLDLKADQETITEIVARCQAAGRMKDLRLFHCGRPEISWHYNVLLRGNPTEIKDKLVGAFSWESEYFKNAAQSFLLTLLRAMVYMRDQKGVSFTLEDVYQATLSPESCLTLETELVNIQAPYRLQEEVGELAQYLRSRENAKELHGLRTQIKLLLDAEFGELIAPKDGNPGIDLFECIQQGQIVYLLLDSQRYGESAVKLGKLILQDLKSASSRILDEVPKENRKHCAIIVDEFADLATEPFIGFLNRARASKLGIILAHQEMSDLDAFSTSMRDQVMGNTSTTVAFLQKMPESAEQLARIAGTKTTVQRTKQLADEAGLLFKSKQYTGVESEREVEEYVIHPNVFKRLAVGECVIIGKYPKAWAKQTKILPPRKAGALSYGEVSQALESAKEKGETSGRRQLTLDLRSKVKKAFSPGLSRGAAPTQEIEKGRPSSDPSQF